MVETVTLFMIFTLHTNPYTKTDIAYQTRPRKLANGAKVREQGQYYTAKHLCLFMSVSVLVSFSSHNSLFLWVCLCLTALLSLCLLMSCVTDYGSNERYQGSVLWNGNDFTLHQCSGLHQRRGETEMEPCTVEINVSAQRGKRECKRLKVFISSHNLYGLQLKVAVKLCLFFFFSCGIVTVHFSQQFTTYRLEFIKGCKVKLELVKHFLKIDILLLWMVCHISLLKMSPKREHHTLAKLITSLQVTSRFTLIYFKRSHAKNGWEFMAPDAKDTLDLQNKYNLIS